MCGQKKAASIKFVRNNQNDANLCLQILCEMISFWRKEDEFAREKNMLYERKLHVSNLLIKSSKCER